MRGRKGQNWPVMIAVVVVAESLEVKQAWMMVAIIMAKGEHWQKALDQLPADSAQSRS